MKRQYHFIFSIFLLLTATTSCKDKTIKDEKIRRFYDTGELRIEKQYINDSIYTLKEYYKNGNLWCEGRLVIVADSVALPIGHWVEYFADGWLEWEGEYIRGTAVAPADSLMDNIDSETSTLRTQLHVENPPARKGVPNNFRVVVPQVNSAYYIVIDSNYVDIPRNPDIQSAFPYTITPEESGEFLIQVMFRDKNGYFIVGERTRYFYIEVE